MQHQRKSCIALLWLKEVLLALMLGAFREPGLQLDMGQCAQTNAALGPT